MVIKKSFTLLVARRTTSFFAVLAIIFIRPFHGSLFHEKFQIRPLAKVYTCKRSLISHLQKLIPRNKLTWKKDNKLIVIFFLNILKANHLLYITQI